MESLFFLLGFSLHNIEEALWLPQWSRRPETGKFHKPVSDNSFRFAVIVVTALGYLIAFQSFLFPDFSLSRYIYRGFVLMMMLNSVFPHLAATVVLRMYCPGTVTGLLLNVPIGLSILLKSVDSLSGWLFTFVTCLCLAVVFLLLLKILFRAGEKLFG